MRSLKICSLVALLVVTLVACGNDKDDQGGNTPGEQVNVVGQWHLTSWCGSIPEFDVYIEFKKDGSFDMYQQTWTFTYEHFAGTYSVDNGVLSGVYSDGSSWVASYRSEVANSKLKLRNKLDLSEVSIYDGCKIPTEVIEEANSSTRSEGVVPFL